MKAICNIDVHVDSQALKSSSQTKKVPQGKKPGAKKWDSVETIFKNKPLSPDIGQQAAWCPTSLGVTTKEGVHPQISSGTNPSVHVDETISAGDGLKTAHTNSGTNEESRADEISKKIKLEDLSDPMKDTRSAFFTLDSLHDEPIIISDEIPHPPSPKLSQIQELIDINQLTKLLVTSLKPELSKLLASHDFASCLPTKLKELPSKFTELSRDIKELKKHVRDMEIELPRDLKEIPTKLETFTSTISSLTSQVAELKNIQWELPAEFLDLPSQVSSVQEKLKTLDSLPSLLNKVTNTLNMFATMVENASGATSINVPSASQATALPAEGKKNTNLAIRDVEPTNLHNELVDLLGIDIVTHYYNKKLLYDKYCDKMLKRRKSSKIINSDKKRKRTGDLKDHSRSTKKYKSSAQQEEEKIETFVSLLEGLQGGKKIALCQKE
ncbi:hypothetical protein Tco_0809949 [Tanacetum coccineum]